MYDLPARNRTLPLLTTLFRFGAPLSGMYIPYTYILLFYLVSFSVSVFVFVFVFLVRPFLFCFWFPYEWTKIRLFPNRDL